ncbi:MAG TPA: UDP-N-acetylmuramate--L-alanine ligase [Chitinophagaceae bacterium]|nr:UDP-N-acetylmuramate--L-alanine ligase [Chitinophagaceae bacterium]HQV85491.1 UDP-N-acetylmuramate--L-alanine ligase [Chitinophagaceae bacterium]HQX71818.1 UDP-N-acetylmuramate--L-alanine ligase [Chitinophagaceae bacterium]
MNTPFRGIEKMNEVYFIGIGGIGMSAIARFFHAGGVKVSGYDKTPTVLTKELEASGIKVHYEENVELVPKNVDLVVYTPAIPAEHKELVYYQTNGYKVVKRSDVLQIISESSFNICIAGTHGKTTITTMVAHLLRDSGFGCNAFLGGIAVNYGTNFWSSERNVCVIEADEYDRSFLKLSPDVAIITAMDADHLDIYGTAEAMEEAFIDFSKRVKLEGLLVRQFGLKRGKELNADRHLTYSLQNESADVYAANIRMMNGSYEFDVMMKDNKLENVRLNMGGMHNVENAVAAITVASSLGIENDKIKAAIENFRGVKRRFEYVIRNERLVFIDDYAHHPEELRALINGAKTLFKQKKCTVIFQPHLYSRTRDLAEGFAQVLDLADEVILLPVYPARELPIEGVSSEMVLEKMKNEHKRVLKKEELTSWVQQDYVRTLNKEFGEVLITAGAGDIDMLVEPMKNELKDL